MSVTPHPDDNDRTVPMPTRAVSATPESETRRQRSRPTTKHLLALSAVAGIVLIAVMAAGSRYVLQEKKPKEPAAPQVMQQASLPTAQPSPRTPEKPFGPRQQMLNEVFEGRNREHSVTASVDRGAVRLSSSRPGYVYVLAASGDQSAQASSRAREEGLDTNPTRYYRDSPVVVKDKVVDGYIATSQTPPGSPADPVYFERVATATTISEATLAYNNASYQDALALYQNAAVRPGGEQLRVLNGIYLASWKLGRANEAEEAFGKVVALGLSSDNLGVKFLFNPGTTNFWSDPQVSGPYGFWLRQIARQALVAKVCMNVVGHTSLTGSQAYNDRLSLQRAAYIKKRLDTEAPELASRTRASGLGFRENLVGTGTDDARDALDRRVEFKITGC